MTLKEIETKKAELRNKITDAKSEEELEEMKSKLLYELDKLLMWANFQSHGEIESTHEFEFYALLTFGYKVPVLQI